MSEPAHKRGHVVWFVATAALDAYEATGELKYYTAGHALGEQMIAKFYDAMGDGFFDTEKVEGAIGALSARRKPLQDAPTPSGNAVAAMVMLRLAALSGDDAYHACAEDTLEAFAGVVEHFGLHYGQIAYIAKSLGGRDLGFYRELTTTGRIEQPGATEP